MRVVRRRRVTFADMVGNVGGTIGLFTGMSMLSLVEVWYWSCRGFASAISALKLKLKSSHINKQ